MDGTPSLLRTSRSEGPSLASYLGHPSIRLKVRMYGAFNLRMATAVMVNVCVLHNSLDMTSDRMKLTRSDRWIQSAPKSLQARGPYACMADDALLFASGVADPPAHTTPPRCAYS